MGPAAAWPAAVAIVWYFAFFPALFTIALLAAGLMKPAWRLGIGITLWLALALSCWLVPVALQAAQQPGDTG